jgi:(R,R)-butanediol dehydrogenase / meso-butanediol dehydrogenase / diacetyl reductase
VIRAAEIAEDRSIQVVERPRPQMGPHEVRVDITYCGICGSDLHMREDPNFPSGSVLGHEFAGRISEVGAEVTDWEVGDRVAVLIYQSCGTCRYCTEGHENFCVDGGHGGWVIGVQGQGGLAESVIASESALFAVPDEVSDQAAALTEPVAVALRAANQVTAEPSDPVVVLGAGPVGLLIASILKHRGYRDLVVVERNPVRRATAESIGLRSAEAAAGGKSAAGAPMHEALSASVQLPEELTGKLSDRPAVVVDATGSSTAIQWATTIVRNRGRVVLVGLPVRGIEVDFAHVILHEIELVGTSSYNRSDFAGALELLAAGAIPAEAIVTDIAPLGDADSKFRELVEATTSQIKILLHP